MYNHLIQLNFKLESNEKSQIEQIIVEQFWLATQLRLEFSFLLQRWIISFSFPWSFDIFTIR